MEKSVHIIVSGRVQGVFFRDYTQRTARNLGLKGEVRNLADGTVEIKAAGEADKVDRLIQWCWEGSPMADVRDVSVGVLSTEEPLPPFRVSN